MDHVHLVENGNGTAFETAAAEFQDFVDSKFLTLVHDSTHAPQIRTYKSCIRRYRTQYNWIAFIDADEFLLVREKCCSLAF